MTEHQLQRALTSLWAAKGITGPGGERLRLVAWEVMAPSWRINDNRAKWNEPSLDFLAVDADNRPVAIEVKTRLTSPAAIRDAACQVTAMTIRLAATADPASITAASRACLSGRHGRLSATTPPVGPVCLDAGWRRLVAAPVIATGRVEDASRCLGLEDPPAVARQWLAANPNRSPRMLSRLAKLDRPPDGVLVGHIEALPLDPELLDEG